MSMDTFTPGDRVRLTCPTPTAQAGDEATVAQVVQHADGSIKALIILIDSDPATTHGTTVFPHEVEKAS